MSVTDANGCVTGLPKAPETECVLVGDGGSVFVSTYVHVHVDACMDIHNFVCSL